MKVIKFVFFILAFYLLASCSSTYVFNENNYKEVRAPFKDNYTALIKIEGETKNIEDQGSPVLYKGSPYTLTLAIENLEPTVTKVDLTEFELVSSETNTNISPVYFEYQGLGEYPDHTRYASFVAKNLDLKYENYTVKASFNVSMGKTVTSLSITSKVVKDFQEYKREK